MAYADIHYIEDSIKLAEQFASQATQAQAAAHQLSSGDTEENLLARANFYMLNAIYHQLRYAQDMQSVQNKPLLAHTDALNDHALAMDRLRLTISKTNSDHC